MHLAKELLLLVKIGRYEMTHEGKEGRNGERFVGFADDLEVNSMPIKVKSEEGRRRINGYHEEDSDDAVILLASGIS